LGLLLSACGAPNPQPAAFTPIPTLAQAATLTLVPSLQQYNLQTSAPVEVGKANDAQGAFIYLQNCSPCHGNQGQGVDAPNLRNSQYIQIGGDQQVYATIADGRAGTKMPAWLQVNGGPLTESEISAVVAYLHTLQGVQAIPSPTPEPAEAPQPPQPTPETSEAEVARPSNPGGPGEAATMTGDASTGQGTFGLYCAQCHGPQGVQGIPNPGSSDESVPVLNPIDPTLVSADAKVFAANVDLFIEHGSVPEGPDPMIVMPSFGDSKMLAPQQIADLIAYIMKLNRTK
jgi:mono/diheme cytochrome c family protein